MRILVLGGTGAMGNPIIKLLAQTGHEVVVTSRRKMKSTHEHIRFVQGNAHDREFIYSLLSEKYDVVIDFMIYTLEEFRERFEYILKNTKQYIFLSSARVYAASEKAITEMSNRLLDVVNDEEYLKTKEYALEKAREENCLIQSNYRNWTIIRPYITYNDERLQLGVLEKEYWLNRAIQGKTIVFSKDIAEKTTTLTHGDDVALRIAEVVGKEKALGEVYHITTSQTIKWGEVLEIYLDTMEKICGKRPKVFMTETAQEVAEILGNRYQISYDRLYNRAFESSKIEAITECQTGYIDTVEGLENCLKNFLASEKRFISNSYILEAYFDRITGEKTFLKEIKGWKQKIKYVIYRYTPFVQFKLLYSKKIRKKRY